MPVYRTKTKRQPRIPKADQASPILVGEFTPTTLEHVQASGEVRLTIEFSGKPYSIDVPPAVALDFASVRNVVLSRFGIFLRPRCRDGYTCEHPSFGSGIWQAALAKAATHGVSRHEGESGIDGGCPDGI